MTTPATPAPLPAGAIEAARTHLAWLLWCFGEGYANAADRAILANWLLDDPATLHADDAALRPHLLEMADEVLEAARPHLAAATQADIMGAAREARLDERERWADLLEAAWGVIANAGWNDDAKSPGWQEAAEHWRDRYHAYLDDLLRPGAEGGGT